MLFAEYKGDEAWASEFPQELADINTCEDGLAHYPLCPECGSRVTHRNESSDGRAAHFAHCNFSGGGGGGGGCSGPSVGESQEHKAMKSIAASAVGFALDGLGIAETTLEVELDAPHSDAERREADCLIEFESPDEQLGDGLIIEVQYKNKSKDKQEVMLDYLLLEQDYSVLWLWESDFHTKSDHPKNWNCKVVQEQVVRDRVRRQVWPLATEESVWEDGDYPPEIWIPAELAGLSSPSVIGPHPTTAMFIQEVADSSDGAGVEARFAGTVIDEIAQEIKRSYGWGEIVDVEHAEKYITEVAETAENPPKPAHFVNDIIDDAILHAKRRDSIGWGALATEPDSERYINEVAQSGETPVATVRLPPEYLTDPRFGVKSAWAVAGANFDLKYKLSDNNAPRRCSDCGERADYYLFIESELSTYKCNRHVGTGLAEPTETNGGEVA